MTDVNDSGAYCTLNDKPCTYCQAGECVWRVVPKGADDDGISKA